MSTEELRVLIVDNSDELLELYYAVFAAAGYIVRRVKTVAEALEAIIDYPPNAVFTSVINQDETGHDLCLKLRNMLGTAELTIVALSSYGKSAYNSDVVAEFDHFLIKPIGITKMLGTMHKLRGYRGDEVPTVYLRRSG